MRYLKSWPDHLMLLPSFMARIFGVFHLVGELEKGVFDVLEAIGRRFAILA